MLTRNKLMLIESDAERRRKERRYAAAQTPENTAALEKAARRGSPSASATNLQRLGLDYQRKLNAVYDHQKSAPTGLYDHVASQIYRQEAKKLKAAADEARKVLRSAAGAHRRLHNDGTQAFHFLDRQNADSDLRMLWHITHLHHGNEGHIVPHRDGTYNIRSQNFIGIGGDPKDTVDAVNYHFKGAKARTTSQELANPARMSLFDAPSYTQHTTSVTLPGQSDE